MILSETQKIFLTVLISIIIGLSLGAVTYLIVKHFRKKDCGICSTGQTCDTSTGKCIGPSGPSGPIGPGGPTGPIGSNCYTEIGDVFYDNCQGGEKTSCCNGSVFCEDTSNPSHKSPPGKRFYCSKSCGNHLSKLNCRVK
jgi:hypothetical protein